MSTLGQTAHAGRITINTGTFTEDTCTVEYDLIKNQAKKPAIRQMMEYANRRALTTLLVSGVVTPYGINNSEKTKLGEVTAKGKSIGNNTYEFPVMGRIEKATVILRQIGATNADGTFQLLMKDSYLFDGQNVVFNSGAQYRVDGAPQGSPASGYVYNFMSVTGGTFSWSTDVSGQKGTYTCMPMYTSYPEGSLKSDGRSKFADMFANNTTIQRSTVAITGTAASQVLWYTFSDAEGGQSKGWMYQELAQQQAQFVMQDERQKWFGVSSMKNADGSYRQTPPTDRQGKPIVQGDGWREQVGGGNVLQGSGTNGEWTSDDITEIMTQLELKSDRVNNLAYITVTGTRGYANFQKQARILGQTQNITFFNQVTGPGHQPSTVGGEIVHVGYNFASFNINGNQMICIKHPLFDDELMWTERGADGNILMSSTAFIMQMNTQETKNMEILYKAANGVSRESVTAKLNGMTGDAEMSLSEEDAMKYALLKEDLLVIYNTQCCGILYKAF